MVCKKTVALGLGDNIDYEILLTADAFQKIVSPLNISEDDIYDRESITTLKDIVSSILYFLKTGKGGEKQIKDISVINSFTSEFPYKTTIGGTAPRAAIVMAKLGCKSFLHLVTVNDVVRKLLPTNADFVCSNSTDSLYPHLIIQFPKDLVVRFHNSVVRSKRANRIIFTNDADNALMLINPVFFEKNRTADILLLSGLNAIQDINLLKARLTFITECLDKYCKNIKIYYEDACFYNPKFPCEVWKSLLPYISIYSLNEDEMQNYIGAEVDLLNPSAILNSLQLLQQKIHVPTLIVHTRYWALAYGTDIENYKTALDAGIIMATTRLRCGDDFSAEDYYSTAKMPREQISEIFCSKIRALSNKVYCIASIAVNQKDVTTIGLGDAFVGGFLAKAASGEK